MGYTFCADVLLSVDTESYLEVMIFSSMKISTGIVENYGSASSMPGTIHCSFGSLAIRACSNLFDFHVRPRLKYGRLAIFPGTTNDEFGTAVHHTPRRRILWDQLRACFDCCIFILSSSD